MPVRLLFPGVVAGVFRRVGEEPPRRKGAPHTEHFRWWVTRAAAHWVERMAAEVEADEADGFSGDEAAVAISFYRRRSGEAIRYYGIEPRPDPPGAITQSDYRERKIRGEVGPPGRTRGSKSAPRLPVGNVPATEAGYGPSRIEAILAPPIPLVVVGRRSAASLPPQGLARETCVFCGALVWTGRPSLLPDVARVCVPCGGADWFHAVAKQIESRGGIVCPALEPR